MFARDTTAAPRVNPRRSKLASAAAIALLALAFAALTAPRVLTAALWGDELRTWRDGIEKPLVDVFLWRHNADHAPLGHLMARAGAAAFGGEVLADRPWSMRLGPWLCALACVPAIWRLGRTLDGDAAGLLMAALLITDRNFVFQSTQARMYAPLMLAGIVALDSAARLFSSRPLDEPGVAGARPPGIVPSAVALAAALAAGLWTHSQTYAVLLPVAVVAIVLLTTPDPGRRRGGRWALAAVGLALAVAAPSAFKLLARRGSDPLDEEEAGRPFAQLEDATQALTGENWLTGALLACAIAGLVVIGRSRGRAVAWLLAGAMAASLLNLLIAARYRPVGFARYLTLLEPPLWAGVAALAVELCRFARRSSRRGVFPVVVVAVGITLLAWWSHATVRTLELLPAHPLAGPYRDALRGAMAEVRAGRQTAAGARWRLVVLPRAPFISYGRVYGLGVLDVRQDEALFDAVAAKAPRGRNRRPPPTTRQLEVLGGDEPVTIVAVVPARAKNRRSADDPLTFARILADARGLSFPPIPTPDGTLRVIVIRFGPNGVDITDPQRPTASTRTK